MTKPFVLPPPLLKSIDSHAVKKLFDVLDEIPLTPTSPTTTVSIYSDSADDVGSLPSFQVPVSNENVVDLTKDDGWMDKTIVLKTDDDGGVMFRNVGCDMWFKAGKDGEKLAVPEYNPPVDFYPAVQSDGRVVWVQL